MGWDAQNPSNKANGQRPRSPSCRERRHSCRGLRGHRAGRHCGKVTSSVSCSHVTSRGIPRVIASKRAVHHVANSEEAGLLLELDDQHRVGQPVLEPRIASRSHHRPAIEVSSTADRLEFESLRATTWAQPAWRMDPQVTRLAASDDQTSFASILPVGPVRVVDHRQRSVHGSPVVTAKRGSGPSRDAGPEGTEAPHDRA